MIALDTSALGIRPRSVRMTMTQVMFALVPGTALYTLLIDYRIVGHIMAACLFALFCEALCLHLRQRAIKSAISDGSILLASWLLVLCLPPSLPLWQLLIGVAILVSLGKHLFGGLGHNPFNPAMVAYAVLLVSFPVTMTDWDLGRHTLIDIHSSNSTSSSSSSSNSNSNDYSAFSIENNTLESWDGISGATVLDRLRDVRQLAAKEADTAATSISSESTNTPSLLAQSDVSVLNIPWTWLSLAWLLGGLYLLRARIISWHIPIALLGTIAILYTLSGLLPVRASLSVLPALFSGAIMLGAFFIATDPVSAAASRAGQLIYGSGIGILTFVIREFSVYPEGIAFAVLLMNLCVPLIDRLSTGKGGRIKLKAPD